MLQSNISGDIIDSSDISQITPLLLDAVRREDFPPVHMPDFPGLNFTRSWLCASLLHGSLRQFFARGIQ